MAHRSIDSVCEQAGKERGAELECCRVSTAGERERRRGRARAAALNRCGGCVIDARMAALARVRRLDFAELLSLLCLHYAASECSRGLRLPE